MNKPRVKAKTLCSFCYYHSGMLIRLSLVRTRTITAWSSLRPSSSVALVQSLTGWFESPTLGANLGDTGATFSSPRFFPRHGGLVPIGLFEHGSWREKKPQHNRLPLHHASCARLKTTLMFRLERYVEKKRTLYSVVFTLMSVSEAFPFVKLFFRRLVMATSELL